jgi:hypothetical protein
MASSKDSFVVRRAKAQELGNIVYEVAMGQVRKSNVDQGCTPNRDYTVGFGYSLVPEKPYETLFHVECNGAVAIPCCYSDSFAIMGTSPSFPSQDDPCHVWHWANIRSLATAHTHPVFHTNAEVNAHHGCFGRTDWYFTDPQLVDWNNTAVYFSTVDKASWRQLYRSDPLYVKEPRTGQNFPIYGLQYVPAGSQTPVEWSFTW